VVHDQPKCGACVRTWASDLLRGGEYIQAMLHFLRAVFFYPFRGDTPDSEAGTAVRGRAVLDLVTQAAERDLKATRPHLTGSPGAATVAKWQPLYIAADQVMDGVCNQIFYGSGAFRNGSNEDGPGLATPDAKRRFLNDFAPILDTIASQAQARTVHKLMQVLAYLEDGDPTAVFDRAAGVLLRPASQGGYQYESLGVDALSLRAGSVRRVALLGAGTPTQLKRDGASGLTSMYLRTQDPAFASEHRHPASVSFRFVQALSGGLDTAADRRQAKSPRAMSLGAF
jgi:hypothetical protein